MKKIINTTIFLFIGSAILFAQGQYGETLMMQTAYPYQAMQFFKNRQNIDIPYQPFMMSSNYAHPVYPSTYATEDFYFFKKQNFKKHKKRTQKVNAQKSHIIWL